jgi:hypothetical protein
LASAHFLFTTVLAEDGMIEFMTKSGILTAKKVPGLGSTGVPGAEQGKLFIELDFPMIDFLDCDEMPSIPETLNGASIVSVHKSAADGDLIEPSLSLSLFFFACRVKNKLPSFKWSLLCSFNSNYMRSFISTIAHLCNLNFRKFNCLMNSLHGFSGGTSFRKRGC